MTEKFISKDAKKSGFNGQMEFRKRSSNFRADLHTHTTCSDGALSPTALVELAKKQGLSGLCITDHDTINAYPEAIAAAKAHTLLLGSGIEISCSFEKRSLHILGYDFDLKSTEIEALCAQNHKQRFERNREIVNLLSSSGMPISIKELEKLESLGGTIGRPHIAQLMVEKGYVAHKKEAFQLYLGDDKPCYVHRNLPSPQEAIATIKKAGGKAFLAHPHLIKDHRLLSRILQLPFDGIECYWGTSFPNHENKFIDIAIKKGLLISGGSDFHGHPDSHAPLGASWVDEPFFLKIFQNLV